MDCMGCGYPLIDDPDDEAYEPGPYCGSCEAGESERLAALAQGK